MSLLKPARKIHKILSYIVFIQVTLWIAGGAYFALVPFQSLVKSRAYYQPSIAEASPSHLAQALMSLETQSLSGLSLVASAQGPLLEAGSQTLSVELGRDASVVSADGVARFARALYTGPGTLSQPKFVSRVEARIGGLVDEVSGRGNLWLVAADDAPGTRLYFDEMGRLVTVRNDAWVWFDALWRLHIMDYGEGEEFNNPLLMAFSVAALLFALSGSVLAVNALGQSLSRRLRRRRRIRTAA
ncbi:hypothetical protein FCL40_15845 [Ferrimonas sediminicola]|uniref:PepSY-associated TM region n=1 Tax=Ferrimonas sediminicola TaxID=2569538 RepID=A0A4V5NUQ4_9GAMM|nr:hypothetical protein [Ferrimonas sediminicola]TKB47322.1 hypothetical protein FCL40_15845 [Ferrimonas sediminicola]